jgi:hypothetical protein
MNQLIRMFILVGLASALPALAQGTLLLSFDYDLQANTAEATHQEEASCWVRSPMPAVTHREPFP